MVAFLFGVSCILVFCGASGMGLGVGNRGAHNPMSTPRGHEITAMSANRVICKCGWNYRLDGMLSLKASRAQDLLLDNWNEHERLVRGVK